MDEEGTVAAAATALHLESAMALLPKRVEIRTLVFDRPFAIVLRDTRTGAIIFIGAIYEP